MDLKNSKRLVGLMLGLGLQGGLSAACAGSPSEAIRQLTYPASFRYVSAKEVRSDMWRLAVDVERLDALLRAGERDASTATEALELLTRMQGTLESLDPTLHRTNHPQIDAHIAAIQRDVAAALEASAREPPDFFFAGAISGSCLYCHQ